jgi:hypothetical protein
MKMIWLVLLCLLLGLNSVAQETENNGKNGDEKTEEVKISKLTLAKKDTEGNIVEDVDVFAPKDLPIYCYVDLDKTEPTAIKMKLIAVRAKGVRPDSNILLVSYKTRKGENGASFRAAPKDIWAVGDYRVEIYLNDKLAESKEFKVEDEK